MNILQEWLSGARSPQGARVLVQGITGKFGRLHAQMMMEYGTNVVAGVTPGKGGEKVNGVPVYDTCADAVGKHGVDASIVFVPAPNYLSAVEEAFEAGIRLVVGITERVPVRDTIRCMETARRHGGSVVGPNTPGLIVPGKIKLGIMPVQPFMPGDVAVLSRSGTLTYEVSNYLRKAGVGINLALGIGGDPIISTNFIEALELIGRNEGVRSVVLIGEIGGDAEERVAEYVRTAAFPKKMVAYIAGRSAPREKRMGHAGAIIMGNVGTVESKEKALTGAGVPVAKMPWEVPRLAKESLGAAT
ncbi:MAG: succinate--CoA ligase subunit alpha [Nitrososphaerota archaeon]|nr:succinate--CoA ligase subunit alpha [Nitrososphaerota archaeon]